MFNGGNISIDFSFIPGVGQQEISSFVGLKGLEEYFELDFGDDFDTWVSEFEIYIADIAKAFDGKVPTSKELHELAKTAKDRAKDMKHIIDKDLTKEDKKQIEEERKTFETILNIYKGYFDGIVNNAINNGKDWINDLMKEYLGENN